MTLSKSRTSFQSNASRLGIGMQTNKLPSEVLIVPHVNQCYRFPYFIKGVPPKWKNSPPSVRLFDPFNTLKFRLKLRMLDEQRRKIPAK